MSPEEVQKAANDLEARIASNAGKTALPICEAAYMRDGQVLIGYTNRDESGGFTPVGDITGWWNAKQNFYAEKMAEAAKKTAESIGARLDEVVLAIRNLGPEAIGSQALRIMELHAALQSAVGLLEHFTARPDHSDEAEQYSIIADAEIERFKALLASHTERA